MYVTRRQVLKALAALPLAARQGRVVAAGAPAALGYLPWWMAAGAQAMPLAALDRVALFDAAIASDASVDARKWAVQAPAGRGPSELVLTLFEPAHFESLFADPARRKALLAGAVRLLGEKFISGLHLDIEGFDAPALAALTGFRAWLAELDAERRRLGKGLSAFFAASDVFTPYDRDAAGRIDYWVAQVYDAHWPEDKSTGPLVTRRKDNPVAVPRALARLAALGVPPAAVLLSVPLYGWEWPCDGEGPGAKTLGRARLLTYRETPQELMPNDRLVATALAREHGLRRDDEGTPYYAYRRGNAWRQGWFEDLSSLTRKFAPERTRGLGGLAFFPLGYDRGEIVEGMLRWWNAAR